MREHWLKVYLDGWMVDEGVKHVQIKAGHNSHLIAFSKTQTTACCC